jgi:hypothetical protein
MPFVIMTGRGRSMGIFHCRRCGQLVFFENTRCERCRQALGHHPELTTLSMLNPLAGGN